MMSTDISKPARLINGIKYCKKALDTYGALQTDELEYLIDILEGKAVLEIKDDPH